MYVALNLFGFDSISSSSSSKDYCQRVTSSYSKTFTIDSIIYLTLNLKIVSNHQWNLDFSDWVSFKFHQNKDFSALAIIKKSLKNPRNGFICSLLDMYHLFINEQISGFRKSNSLFVTNLFLSTKKSVRKNLIGKSLKVKSSRQKKCGRCNLQEPKSKQSFNKLTNLQFRVEFKYFRKWFSIWDTVPSGEKLFLCLQEINFMSQKSFHEMNLFFFICLHKPLKNSFHPFQPLN